MQACYVDWQMVLEFSKVLVSWPVVVSGVFTALLWNFRPNIAKLIDELKGVDSPVGSFHRVPNPMPPPDPLASAAAGVQAQPGTRPNTTLPHHLQGTTQGEQLLAYVITNPGPTIGEYDRLRVAFLSERLLRGIYGTQVELLENMVSTGSSKSYAELATAHRKYVAKSGNSAYTVESYVSFLVNSQLIEKDPADQARYRATEFAVQFLDYLRQELPHVDLNTVPT